MPRGVKGSGTPRTPKKSIDERIADIEKTIEAYKKQISELTAQKKALIEEKELERTSELLKALKETGMSTDQILELIKKNKETQ